MIQNASHIVSLLGFSIEMKLWNNFKEIKYFFFLTIWYMNMHFVLILNKLWDSLCLNAWFLKYSSRCHRQLVSVIFQLMEKPLSNLIFFPSAGKLQIKSSLPNKWQKDYLNAGYLISLLALPPLSSTVSLAVALSLNLLNWWLF